MRTTSASLALVCVLIASGPTAAEGFFDLYAGGASTQDDRETLQLPGFLPRARLEFRDSPVFGARMGVWGEGRLPFLGAAIDVSGFRPDGQDRFGPAELYVVPASFLLMGRVPLLRSDAFPMGQIQPYAAVGPSLVVSHLEIPYPGSNFKDLDADLGLDVRGGLSFLLDHRIGVFAEYRLTHFEPDYSDRVLGVRAKVSPELTTHFIQTGLRFQFYPYH